ncbi:MAG: FIVAR domain-containing protein [Clostridia bacterium]|nr:FIVAR domain-containing protein [Clostridia bacterium]
MKKIISVILSVIVILILSGCNEKEKASLQEVIEQEVKAEDTYTPASYQEYKVALQNAISVKKETFASTEKLHKAEKNLQSAIDNLYPKPDKSELAGLVEKALAINENIYTTASCLSLNAEISSAQAVINNEEATIQDVEQAANDLNTALRGMTKSTKGVYKIYYSFNMLANNHVGNEWLKGVTYNGINIYSGDTVTAPLNSSIKINIYVIENDKIPDIGSESISLLLNGAKISAKIFVCENRGRYTGNIATWEFTCHAALKERL